MDKAQLKQAIEKIESEKSIHDEKFAGQPEHNYCIQRFNKVLDRMYAQLLDLSRQRMDFSASVSALPDAIEDAFARQEIARDLQANQHSQAALQLKQQAQAAMFKELNELDGFDR